jgi:hypothetical protein
MRSRDKVRQGAVESRGERYVPTASKMYLPYVRTVQEVPASFATPTLIRAEDVARDEVGLCWRGGGNRSAAELRYRTVQSVGVYIREEVPWASCTNSSPIWC